MGSRMIMVVGAWLLGGVACPASAQWPEVSPLFERISGKGGDAILEGEVVVEGGRLQNWPDPRLKPLRDIRFPEPNGECQVPENEDFPGKDNWRKPRVIACMDDHFWVATRAYCAELSREQGSLYRINKGDGHLQAFPVVPECHEATSLVEHGGRVWFGTLRPIEKYRARTGAGVVVFDPAAAEPKAQSFLKPWTITALGEVGGALWAVGHQGVARLAPDDGSWEKRYYHLFVAPDDSLRVGLAETPQSEEEQALFEYLLTFPISDMQGFVEQARGSGESVSQWWQGGSRPEFLPWYLDALKRYRKGERKGPDHSVDYWFSRLVGMVLRIRERHPEQVDDARVREVFRALWEQPHTAERKKTILEAWRTLGMDTGDRAQAMTFTQYKESWQRHPERRRLYNKLCALVVLYPRFGEDLVELFDRLPLPEGASARACLNGQGAVYTRRGECKTGAATGSRRLQRAGGGDIEARIGEMGAVKCIRIEAETSPD